MNRFQTIAASLGLGVGLLTTAITATAGDQWQYKEERASVITRDGEMERRSRDGWRIIDVGETDDGHLMIIGRTADAATGRDAERSFVYTRTTLDKMVADFDAMGKDGYTLDSVVATSDRDYQAVFSRPQNYRPVRGLSGSSWAFKLVDLGNGDRSADLRRAGDDGWIALELLRDGNSVKALMVQDPGPGARHARYDYEYRRVLPTSAADLARVTDQYNIVAMAPDGAQLGLLVARDRGQVFRPTYEYQILDGGNRADQTERALNTAGKDGWKLLDIDEDNRAVRLLMRRPKGN